MATLEILRSNLSLSESDRLRWYLKFALLPWTQGPKQGLVSHLSDSDRCETNPGFDFCISTSFCSLECHLIQEAEADSRRLSDLPNILAKTVSAASQKPYILQIGAAGAA